MAALSTPAAPAFAIGPDLARCAKFAEDAANPRDRELWVALQEAIRFVRDKTGYFNLDPPCVVWESQEWVNARISRQPNLISSGFVPTALYNCGTRIMYLTDDLAPAVSQPRTVSILIHELVHHGQCVSNSHPRMSSCDREHEAYFVQADYAQYKAQRLSNYFERRDMEAFAVRTRAAPARVCALAK